MANAQKQHSDDVGLKAALRDARVSEAVHLEAVLNLRDSKSIRLQLLKDDLLPAVAAFPAAGDLFDLALVPGDPPKLWIDLISAVVMEPDHRTYRLTRDRQDDREILFESDDRATMSDFVRRFMAHRLVVRERQAVTAALPPPPVGYSTGSLILAWTSGFAFGALALVGISIYMKILHF